MLFKKSFLAVAAAVSPALAHSSQSSTTTTSSAFGGLNLYWGQYGQPDDRLSSYCDAPGVTSVSVSFVTYSPKNSGGWPGTNFAGHCGGEVFYHDKATGEDTKLIMNCDYIKTDIKYCQSKGIKILLAIGGYCPQGGPCSYDIDSEQQGHEFGELLHKTFGPFEEGWTGPRPFDISATEHVAVDGFDFDLEFKYPDQKPWVRMVEKLRSCGHYYVSASPQCPTSDEWFQLKELIYNAQFDSLFIQFYNNPGCQVSDTPNYDEWETVISETSKSQDAKLFIGVLASPDAGWNGYAPPKTIKDLICKVKGKKHFGGVSVWDATRGAMNKINGQTFYEAIADALKYGCDEIPPKFVSSSASASASATVSVSVSASSAGASTSVSASASASASNSGSASASGSVSATASGSASVSASASGSASDSGASVSATVTGSASASATLTASASGSASATGSVTASATASSSGSASSSAATNTVTSVSASASASATKSASSTADTCDEDDDGFPSTKTFSNSQSATASASSTGSGSGSGNGSSSGTGGASGTTNPTATGSVSDKAVSTSTPGDSPPYSGGHDDGSITQSAKNTATASAADGMTTSTVFTTTVYTVTSCKPAVPCTIGQVVTATVPWHTTVCPISAVSSDAPQPTTTSAPLWVTSTVYATDTYTITSCGPNVPYCPVGQITTQVVPAYTTICPYTGMTSTEGGKPSDSVPKPPNSSGGNPKTPKTTGNGPKPPTVTGGNNPSGDVSTSPKNTGVQGGSNPSGNAHTPPPKPTTPVGSGSDKCSGPNCPATGGGQGSAVIYTTLTIPVSLKSNTTLPGAGTNSKPTSTGGLTVATPSKPVQAGAGKVGAVGVAGFVAVVAAFLL